MKKIYLLPNFITTGNFLSGILSITNSLQGNFPRAALWILIAMLFDFLDGQIARMSKSGTKFGEEYDSLSDLVTFGLAPTIMMYEMCLSQLGRFGWGVAFIYSVTCALRLARYNAKLDGRPKTFFTGLPSPAAGGLIASSVLAADHLEWFGVEEVGPFMMLVLGFLMISTLRYPSLHAFGLKSKGPFLYLGLGAISLGGFILLGEVCLSVGFLIYTLGGLAYDLFHRSHGIDEDESPYSYEVEEVKGVTR